MRILLVNDSPLVGSGSGTTTEELARALVGAGHEVRCLVVADRAEITAPFPVRAIVCSAQASESALPFDFPAWTWHGATRSSYAALTDEQFHHLHETLRVELDREVSDFDPHVIHAQHTGLLAHLALESGVPYVMSAHAASMRVASEDSHLQPLAEQAAENASAVLVTSRFLAAEFKRLFPAVDARVEVLLPELTRDVLDPAEPLGPERMSAGLGFATREGPLVVFAGTLVPRHGATTLVNAAAICESVHPTVRTIMVGDGPQREELRVQAERLGLERTHLLGWQPRALVQILLAEAAVVAVPSRGAPSTWALLEALAAGAPIVASVGDGREELFATEMGALVPPDDHELLADSILRGIAESWKAKNGPLLALRASQRIDSARWALANVARYEQASRERGRNA